MLVYGGRNRENQQICDRTAIYVLDMTKLICEQVYDPNGEEYQVPKEIYDVIGGSPYGGATLLPENSMANTKLEATFRDIIAKNKLTNGTSTSDPDTTSGTRVKEGSRIGVSGGAIAGIVVGVFVGISLIVWGTRRFRKQWNGSGLIEVNGATPLAEISTTLPPGELHAHSSAQELSAYMPNEMASRIDEEHTRVSPNPSSDAVVKRGVQHCTKYEYGGEGVQEQSDYARSEGTQ